MEVFSMETSVSFRMSSHTARIRVTQDPNSAAVAAAAVDFIAAAASAAATAHLCFGPLDLRINFITLCTVWCTQLHTQVPLLPLIVVFLFTVFLSLLIG